MSLSRISFNLELGPVSGGDALVKFLLKLTNEINPKIETTLKDRPTLTLLRRSLDKVVWNREPAPPYYSDQMLEV